MNARRRLGLQLLLWAMALALLIWTFAQVALAEIIATLGALSLGQLVLLFSLNAVIIVLFGLRWYLFLRALGHRIPYLAIIRYRLAAFAVSYLTPGPHIGGEPLQVYYLGRNHGVPLKDNLAALSMDKLIELITNFSVLLAGLTLTLSSGVFGPQLSGPALAGSLAVLSLPLLYFIQIRRGRRPLSWLLARMPARWLRRARREAFAAEKRMVLLVQRAPGVLWLAAAASALVWAALFIEYDLALHFLGLPISPLELVVIITAGRLALLTPMPSAVGALEFSQVVALEALGYPASVGLSISLLIRARDLLFSAIGLLWGRVFAIKV